jgi:hypothetical protein
MSAFGVKQTLIGRALMSAFDPKRTWGGPLGRNERHNSQSKSVIFFSYPM